MERIGRRIEADVARRSAGPWPVGRPVRGSWRAGSRAIRARRAGPCPLRRRVSPSQGGPPRRLRTGTAAHERSFTDPMLSCGLRCRRPSRGGSAIGAPSTAGRQGVAGPSSRRILIAIPIIVLLVTGMLGRRRDAVHRGRVQLLRAGPARPRSAAQRPRLRAADDRLRPDRQGRAGAARDAPPRGRRRSTAIPDEMLDATTAIEDQDLLDEPGLRPGRPSSAPASTRSPAGRAAPRRSPSSSSAPGSCRPRRSRASTYERKIREIIQSIRLTEAYPGDKGKQEIITAYLNQNFYGNQTYGVKAAAEATSARRSRT